MIERKFSNDSIKLFSHDIIISDCKEWAIARPVLMGLVGYVQDAVTVYEHFEEKGYELVFSRGPTLFFRRKKQDKK